MYLDFRSKVFLLMIGSDVDIKVVNFMLKVSVPLLHRILHG